MKDNCIDGVVRRRIDQVRIGDRLDLQNDMFADSTAHETDGAETDHPEFEFEFATVEAIELEPHDTDPCIVLHTSQGSFGFPPDHWIEVDGKQVRDTENQNV